MNNIINDLESKLKYSKEFKTSHWKSILDNADYKKINDNFGFGCWEKKIFYLNFIYFILQRIVYGNSIFQTNAKKLFEKLCILQNRNFDNDVIRHIFTFNLLEKYDLLKKNICIIGDGKANFVGGLLQLNSNIKIFSINLTEVLIHDYLIIKKFNLIDDSEIIVAKKDADLYEKNKRLFLINALDADFLKNKNINLFINIASMQEMKEEHIKNYFDIIKTNKAYFYCCNREYKKLIGGEETNFNKYPWGDYKKIIFEDCPWNQKYYELRFPFIFSYIRENEAKAKHALVKYN